MRNSKKVLAKIENECKANSKYKTYGDSKDKLCFEYGYVTSGLTFEIDKLEAKVRELKAEAKKNELTTAQNQSLAYIVQNYLANYESILDKNKLAMIERITNKLNLKKFILWRF